MGAYNAGGFQMTIAEFFSMAGYGDYIWSSFALTLVLMVGEFIFLRKKHKQTIRRLQRMVQLNNR